MNGASFPLNLVRGEPHEGSYAITIQLGSLQQEGTGPNWWVAQTPCMQYHFEVLPAAGAAPEGGRTRLLQSFRPSSRSSLVNGPLLF